MYRDGQVAISGKPVKAKEVEKSFSSLAEVYADIADWEVSAFFQAEDRREVAATLKAHNTLVRHRLPDGRELLQVSFEIGDPMDFKANGCSGDCQHYFYIGDKGRFHHAGAEMHFVTLDLGKTPVTLLVEDKRRTRSEFSCYALSSPAPGYQDHFVLEKMGRDNPCGLKDGGPAQH